MNVEITHSWPGKAASPWKYRCSTGAALKATKLSQSDRSAPEISFRRSEHKRLDPVVRNAPILTPNRADGK